VKHCTALHWRAHGINGNLRASQMGPVLKQLHPQARTCLSSPFGRRACRRREHGGFVSSKTQAAPDGVVRPSRRRWNWLRACWEELGRAGKSWEVHVHDRPQGRASRRIVLGDLVPVLIILCRAKQRRYLPTLFPFLALCKPPKVSSNLVSRASPTHLHPRPQHPLPLTSARLSTSASTLTSTSTSTSSLRRSNRVLAI
jgi:hypothetical protein